MPSAMAVQSLLKLLWTLGSLVYLVTGRLPKPSCYCEYLGHLFMLYCDLHRHCLTVHLSCIQWCSGAGTRGNSIPINILAWEWHSHKCVSCKWERWCDSIPINILNYSNHALIKHSNHWAMLLSCVVKATHTHTQHTTVLRLCGICPGKPG